MSFEYLPKLTQQDVQDLVSYNPLLLNNNDIGPPKIEPYYQNDDIWNLSSQSLFDLCERYEKTSSHPLNIPSNDFYTPNWTEDIFSMQEIELIENCNFELDSIQINDFSFDNSVTIKESVVVLHRLNPKEIERYTKPEVKRLIKKSPRKKLSTRQTCETRCPYNLRSKKHINFDNSKIDKKVISSRHKRYVIRKGS